MTLILAPMTPDEVQALVRQRTAEIHAMLRCTAQDIVDIGGKLTEVKERLDHGQFGDWLQQEFQWSERTARNFMAVYERFKSANFADLAIAPSALYLLASPSVSEETAQAVIERAQSGESITFSAAASHVQAVVRINEALKVAPEAVRNAAIAWGVSVPENINTVADAYKRKTDYATTLILSGEL